MPLFTVTMKSGRSTETGDPHIESQLRSDEHWHAGKHFAATRGQSSRLHRGAPGATFAARLSRSGNVSCNPVLEHCTSMVGVEQSL
jgi:hypothetical protein